MGDSSVQFSCQRLFGQKIHDLHAFRFRDNSRSWIFQNIVRNEAMYAVAVPLLIFASCGERG